MKKILIAKGWQETWQKTVKRIIRNAKASTKTQPKTRWDKVPQNTDTHKTEHNRKH